MSEPRPLKVFLCHASADKPAVRKLHRYLKQRGVQPWLDELDLLPGQDWQVEIPNALFSSDVILVCLSKNSINKEGYIQKEITYALDKAMEKPEGTIFIIPAKLDDCDVPQRLSLYHSVDLSNSDGHKRLMLSLNQRAMDLDYNLNSGLTAKIPMSKQPKRKSVKSDRNTTATGQQMEQRHVDIAGNAKGTTIITGDHNVIIQSSMEQMEKLPKDDKPATISHILSNVQGKEKASQENPFFIGGAIPSDLFVGRTSTLAFIRSRLGGKSLQSVSIVGERRIGKSSLLRYVAERAEELFSIRSIIVTLDLMRGYCQTRKGFMKALRLAIKDACGKEPWSENDDNDIASLSFGIDDISDSGIRLILCLDEVEELTRRQKEFDEVLEALRAAGQMGQIGLLTASAHPLGDLCKSNGLLSPFFNIFMQDTLGLLTTDEWHNLVTSKMDVTQDELSMIEHIANGHPFYTQIAASRLWDVKYGHQTFNWMDLAKADIEPHFQSQWQHFTETEKSILRHASRETSTINEQRVIENLERRGILVNGKPFSALFRDWLRNN